MLWHAYVDESGDRGWLRKPADTPVGTRLGSSEHFSMTAVLVPDGSQTAILDRWQNAAAEIGRTRTDTIHWVNVKSHGQRMHLSGVVREFGGLHTCSVVLSKWDMNNANAIRQPRFLYGWVLRLLIERLSWFAKRHEGQMVMHFAQVKGLPPAGIAAYVDRLQQQETTIDWSSLVLPLRINTPQNQRMLQIADTASGAVHAAFEWDSYGNTESRYLEIIRPRIWCPGGGNMKSYGLKVAPFPHPRHPWLERFCSGK
jgi:hypothetical protein